MDLIRNIVAAVDKFPQDEPVLLRAAEIARTHGAKLTIVHVIESLTGFAFVSTDLRRIQHQMRLDAHQRIEAAIAKWVVGVDEIDICIENGEAPSQRLTDLSDEINAALIVMRAHQRDSMLEKIIGSTTDRVIRTSRVPVLVVKRPVTQAYQRAVVSIDTSDDSNALVPIMVTLFPLIKLCLMHVVYISIQFEEAMRRAGSGQASISAHHDALILRANTHLSELSKTLNDRSMRSSARVIEGDPATSLVRATWSPKADLIVLGPNSTGWIRQALLGSVTQRVLQTSTCDVLIYRTPPQDK